MNAQHFRDAVNKFGLHAAVQDIACRAANKVTDVMILKGLSLTMDSVDPSFFHGNGGCHWGFLDEAALRRAVKNAADPADDMDEAFIEAALAKGDRCYGALDGDVLVSHGWYSTVPTHLSDDLVLHFDRAYTYMYKGYTRPAYRGRRLHGIGMAGAMKAYATEGKRGLVSYVESTNFSSLRSCYRMGYRDFGRILCVLSAGRYVTHATAGCGAYGFRLEPASR